MNVIVFDFEQNENLIINDETAANIETVLSFGIFLLHFDL